MRACAFPSMPRRPRMPRETITYYMQRQAGLTLESLGRTGSVAVRRDQAGRLSTLTYDDILTRKVAFGTAPALIDRLGQLKEELGLTGVAAELNPGGLLPFDQEMRSLQILTQQVMPALK